MNRFQCSDLGFSHHSGFSVPRLGVAVSGYGLGFSKHKLNYSSTTKLEKWKKSCTCAHKLRTAKRFASNRKKSRNSGSLNRVVEHKYIKG